MSSINLGILIFNLILKENIGIKLLLPMHKNKSFSYLKLLRFVNCQILYHNFGINSCFSHEPIANFMSNYDH